MGNGTNRKHKSSSSTQLYNYIRVLENILEKFEIVQNIALWLKTGTTKSALITAVQIYSQS